VVEQLNEARALVRRALELIDACDDPCQVAPYLDLAIARLGGDAESPRNDNFEEQPGQLPLIRRPDPGGRSGVS
jgi:hypothetical protein